MENIGKIAPRKPVQRPASGVIRFYRSFARTAALLGLCHLLVNCTSDVSRQSNQTTQLRPAKIPLGTAFVLSNLPMAKKCESEAKRPLDQTASDSICTQSLNGEYLTTRQRATVHLNRGVIRYRLGRYEEAIEDFTFAIDTYGMRTPQAYTNRGLTYEVLAMEQRRFEALARADYQTAVSLNPESPVALARLEELTKPFLERRPLIQKIRS